MSGDRFNRFWRSGRVALLCIAACLCVSMAQGAALNLYVAPEAAGAGDGSAREAAAGFRNMGFWNGINAKLAGQPVTVTFLAGQYVVSEDKGRNMPALALEGLGHERNQLVIEGERAGDVVFTRHAEDKKVADYPEKERPSLKGPGLFSLGDGQNATIRNLTFTAPNVPIGYATNFSGGRNVVIENCHWHDLQGVYYGATGASGIETDHVTFRNCRFERVGSGGHAHMAYNAYDPLHIRFIDCYFEDCAGDYVRFRDGADYGVVTGCTFRSTGKYIGTHTPFVTMPLFNDDDPTSHSRTPNYEYFGTNFLIFNNKFIYDTEEKPDTRIAVLFHHSGFSPPERNHLLTAEEGAVLKNGTPEEKKALIMKNLGFDVTKVYVYNNEYTNVAHKGAYRAGAQYGATNRGGDGLYDIDDLFNAEPVVKTAEEALAYFGNRTERTH